jgi:hypothetical protein
LGVKELWSLARDPIMLVLVLFAFTVSVYTGASALPETLSHAPIAIIDEDQSPLSQRIIAAFQPPYFLLPKLITQAEMDERMDAGLDTFALNIPVDFQRNVLAGRRPAIQLNIDATRMSQAFTGNGYVQSIIRQEVQEFSDRYRSNPTLPVELSMRMRFNPTLNTVWFGAIMQVINQITMLSIVLTGTALIRERERGTIEHLLAMPVNGVGRIVRQRVFVVRRCPRYVGGTSQRFHRSVPAGHNLASVCDHVHGHLHGHLRTIDATVRIVADVGAITSANVVRWHDAAREHARSRAKHHAGGTHHALRQARTSGPVSRRGFQHRLAPIRCVGADRSDLLLRFAISFPQSDRHNGVKRRVFSNQNARRDDHTAKDDTFRREPGLCVRHQLKKEQLAHALQS